MPTPPDRELSKALIERYDSESRAYRDYWAPAVLPVACRMVEQPKIDHVGAVLDIGTGVGTALPFLKQRFPDALVVGVDRSEGMVSLADTVVPLSVMDALHLALRTDTFDLAVMSLVLFHLPNAIGGLIEAARVLRPGGCLCVSTWADDIDSPAVCIWNEELDASGAIPGDELPRLANHHAMDTPAKVKQLLTSAGFRSVRADIHEFTHVMPLEHFVALRAGVGATAQRLESLDEQTRAECVSGARRRLAELATDDFTFRMNIILAFGEAPQHQP